MYLDIRIAARQDKEIHLRLFIHWNNGESNIVETKRRVYLIQQFGPYKILVLTDRSLTVIVIVLI